MAERKVSVRLSAVGGKEMKAELVALGDAGSRALGRIAGGAEPASRGLAGLSRSAGAALGAMEALAARATRTATALRAAGASTGSLRERIDQVTGAAPRIGRSAGDIAAYGAALDDLRTKYNPLFAVIRRYRASLEDIRQAHRVGAIGADEMGAAISRERQAALASIAAIKGRGTALTQMAGASRFAAYQSRMLMFQLNDIFVTLASGMNPLMVLIQQGPQIAQIYGAGQGGIGGALRDTGRMLGGLLTRFPLLTAAVAASGVAMAGMRAEINKTSDVAVSFGDVALAVWQTVRDGLLRVLKPAIDLIGPWFSAAWDLVVEGVRLAGNAIINAFRAAFEAIRAIWGTLPALIGAAVLGAANATILGLEIMVNRAIGLLNGLATRVNELLANIPGLPEGLRVGTLEALDIPRIENPYPEQVMGAAGELRTRMAEILASDPLGEFFGTIRDRAVENASALDETSEAAGRAGGAMRRAGEQAAEGMETAKTAIDQVREALSDYAARAADIGKGLGETIAGAFSSAEEAVATFVRTGKIGFSELVTSILADLAKIAVRKAVLGPIAEALSGALGGSGLFQGIAGVLGGTFHDGGRVPGGRSTLIPVAALANAPRFHGGGGFGLRPDEQAAILQRGERVLNRRETREWEGGGGTRIVINARDATSFRASRAQVAADIARAVAYGRRGL
jgi:hypothetical protein